MVSPHRIRYNQIFSNELNIPDLIMCVAMDSDNGETPSFLNREAVSSESHDGRYKRIHKFKFTESFAPKFSFFKSDFGNFEMEEVRAVLKWLTSKDTTSLLETYYDDSNVVSWASIGGFVDLQTYKIANNRTIAITATWDSISPFAFSDLYTVTRDASGEINTTVYYWIAGHRSGASIPSEYMLTIAQFPMVGTMVYYVRTPINSSVFTTELIPYGQITKIESDLYTVGESTFTLTAQGSKTKRTYDNKITINIDTDDNQPVYPKITVRHKGAIVAIAPNTTLTESSDMVDNTVYFNGTNYYWRSDTTDILVGTASPGYEGWDIVSRHTVYSETDEIKANTVYYYTSDQKYRWIDPYVFKTSIKNPNLNTTSVKITNRHYDFFNQPSPPVTMIVKNNMMTEQIEVDGANKIISSTNTRRIFGDDFVDWTWLPLYDGRNELTIEGNCDVKIEYREVRKIGEY